MAVKLGDRVKDLTDALGIKSCATCRDRQAKLNDWSDWLERQLGLGVEPSEPVVDSENGIDTGKQ